MTANNIAALLDARGMSQAALAEKIGFSQPHVTRLISGETNLNPNHIRKIAAALGCSEIEITDEFTPPLPPLARQMLLGFEKLTPVQQEAYVQQINSIVEPMVAEHRARRTG